jgi:hypothetical protein
MILQRANPFKKMYARFWPGVFRGMKHSYHLVECGPKCSGMGCMTNLTATLFVIPSLVGFPEHSQRTVAGLRDRVTEMGLVYRMCKLWTSLTTAQNIWQQDQPTSKYFKRRGLAWDQVEIFRLGLKNPVFLNVLIQTITLLSITSLYILNIWSWTSVGVDLQKPSFCSLQI